MGIVGEVGGKVQDYWGCQEGGTCKVSTFALAWIEGIKVDGGGGMWYIFYSLEKNLKKYPMFVCSILYYVSNVTFF